MRQTSSNRETTRVRFPGLNRRKSLQAAAAGLSLPNLFRMRAEAGLSDQNERTAIIVLFCHGGPSHIDTYDPKPGAPGEIRGPFQPIDTVAPGLSIVSVITLDAVKSLDLKVGGRAYAVIKASSVMVGVD